jgi:uncharacterized 2Fe-2S/4Fe-4S cluster protein (DUF4445 family)
VSHAGSSDPERRGQARRRITFRPDDSTTQVPAGTTVYQAAAWIGRAIDSSCGARATCGKCRVRLCQGTSHVTPADHEHLSAGEIAAGWRLSCTAEIQDDTIVEIPRLMTAPKTAMAGTGRPVLLDANVRKVHLRLDEPELDDQRSDLQRVRDHLRAEGFACSAGLDLLRMMPGALRRHRFDVTAVLCGEWLIDLEPGDTTGECFGIALDLGTTTIVGTLLDLTDGSSHGVASALNAQAVHGSDVLSRISHVMSHADGLSELQALAATSINGIVDDLANQAGVSPARIYEMIVAGNATMIHLLLGIDPEPLSIAPFTPTLTEPVCVPAAHLSLSLHPRGRLYALPALGAYVGGDIVAGLLATSLPRESRLRLFVDVGTNGEIALGSDQRTIATAAPAGPAFEGAEIACGMRAVAGAIEEVRISEDAVELRTIEDRPPAGLCGSGLIDAVAQLVRRGVIDTSGKMLTIEQAREGLPPSLAERVVDIDGVRAFVLAAGERGEKPVVLSQKDVRQLQFAKGAIATGIQVLMNEMKVSADDLDEVLLAGAFGTYIHPESARIIGLVPAVSLDRVRAVGNAAGEGAKIVLVSSRERKAAEEMPRRVEYLELSGRSNFNDLFMAALGFPPPSRQP